jgi:ribosomal protein L25 (general stress protein Ctc)
MRKLKGTQARIPGVLMLPGQDPVLLTVNPNHIQKWLLKEHFLGRRYLLSIDGKDAIEVYPATLGMHPVSLYPHSVSFATYKGVMPRQRLAPEMRFKIRKYDEIYLKEERLMRSIAEINKRLKEDAQAAPRIQFDIPESFTKPYSGPSTRKRMLSLEEEVRGLIEASRSGEILKLEPEEMDRDEVMQVEEEEDE